MGACDADEAAAGLETAAVNVALEGVEKLKGVDWENDPNAADVDGVKEKAGAEVGANVAAEGAKIDEEDCGMLNAKLLEVATEDVVLLAKRDEELEAGAANVGAEEALGVFEKREPEDPNNGADEEAGPDVAGKRVRVPNPEVEPAPNERDVVGAGVDGVPNNGCD